MTSREAVVLRIKELCAERGLSYYTLAFRSAIPKSSLMNIMYGTNPTIATINKICGGLNLTLLDFFNSPLFLECDDFDDDLPQKE